MSIIITTLSILSVAASTAAIIFKLNLNDRDDTIERLESGHRKALWDASHYKHLFERAQEKASELSLPAINLGIAHVLLYARLPDGGIHKTDFRLGEGPCGKTVVWLQWNDSKDNDTYCLTQYHSDGSHKKFLFRKYDVHGRIVIQRERMEVPESVRPQLQRNGRVRWVG